MRQTMTGECIDISTELESWYAREGGQHLLQRTRQALAGLLERSFGYHILQIGSFPGTPLFDGSPINHRVYVAERSGDGVSLVANAGELPLESDSVDTVIAHHALDFAANPHQVLREIQRVLTPQGQLLVIGFNPYSVLGINSLLRGLHGKSLWREHHPVSVKRLTDWLHLLGCEVQDCTRICSLPLAGGGRFRRWLARADQWGDRHNLPSGSLYILHALKQVSAVHRPQRHFRLAGGRLIGLVPKPAAAPTPAPFRPVRGHPGTAARNGGDTAA